MKNLTVDRARSLVEKNVTLTAKVEGGAKAILPEKASLVLDDPRFRAQVAELTGDGFRLPSDTARTMGGLVGAQTRPQNNLRPT